MTVHNVIIALNGLPVRKACTMIRWTSSQTHRQVTDQSKASSTRWVTGPELGQLS